MKAQIQLLSFAEHHHSSVRAPQVTQAHRRYGPAENVVSSVVVSVNRLVKTSSEIATQRFSQDSTAALVSNSVGVNVSKSVLVVVNK